MFQKVKFFQCIRIRSLFIFVNTLTVSVIFVVLIFSLPFHAESSTGSIYNSGADGIGKYCGKIPSYNYTRGIWKVMNIHPYNFTE